MLPESDKGRKGEARHGVSQGGKERANRELGARKQGGGTTNPQPHGVALGDAAKAVDDEPWLVAKPATTTYRQQYTERVIAPWSYIEVSHLGWMGRWSGHQCVALWDTGAECTAISKEVAEKIGAELTDGTSVRGIDGAREASHTVVNLRIGDIVVPMKLVKVLDVSGEDRPDVWIGMDIISMGRFEVDSSSGKTVLTFEI